MIQTGIATTYNKPVLIVEVKNGVPMEIAPSDNPRIPFCDKFRKMKLTDGKAAGDITCKYELFITAGRLIKDNITDEKLGWCHLGLVKLFFPIIVAHRVIGILYGGQIVYDHMKEHILESLDEWVKGNPDEKLLKNDNFKKEICIENYSSKIDNAIIEDLKKDLTDGPEHKIEEFEKISEWLEEYSGYISELGDNIYITRKKTAEEKFLNELALSLETAQCENIIELRRYVETILNKINTFCGLKHSIIFSDYPEGGPQWEVLGSSGEYTKIGKVHFNPKKAGFHISKDIHKAINNMGLRAGNMPEILTKFALWPYIIDENKLNLIFAFGPRKESMSLDNIVNIISEEREFIDSLTRLIGSAISNQINWIKLINEKNHLSDRAEKLKTKVDTIAHDIKVSLNPISMKIGLWFKKCQFIPGAEDEMKPLFDTISEQIERLKNNTNQQLTMLNYNTEKDLNKEVISLTQLIKKCTANFIPVAEKKNIKIIFDDSLSDLPDYPIASTLFIQAINNLLDNAIKYSFSNTEISIYSKNYINGHTIFFSNYGWGVNEDEKRLVFKSKYRGKSANLSGESGSGLGLGHAQDVIELHSGFIRIESYSGERFDNSKEGQGYRNVIEITLPKLKGSRIQLLSATLLVGKRGQAVVVSQALRPASQRSLDEEIRTAYP